jgi:hypothetical protein
MPISPNPIVGFTSFAVVKLVGYSLFGQRLNKSIGENAIPAYMFGFCRTVVGVIVGLILLWLIDTAFHANTIIFFIALIPVRFLEWKYTIKAIYNESELLSQHINRASLIGIAWSFILDIPVIASLFLIPGGMWIC